MDVVTQRRELLRRGSRGAEVARFQRVLTLLGDYDARVDGVFGPATEAAVRAFQSRNGLEADGVLGPRTAARIDEVLLHGEEPLEQLRHAWRERDSAELDVAPPQEAPPPGDGDGLVPTRPSGVDGGHAAASHDADRARLILARAEEEWRRPVMEPDGSGWERIDAYIRGPEGLQWTWEDRYVANRQFAWCGAFAAYCFAAAGLSAEIRKRVMPSTYRLHSWAKGNARMLPADAVAPGDIVIVGPAGGKRWGAHITLCESVTDGQVRTFEGNAHGTGPDGQRYEGVIRQHRPLSGDGLEPRRYRVMHVIRPLPEDYD